MDKNFSRNFIAEKKLFVAVCLGLIIAFLVTSLPEIPTAEAKWGKSSGRSSGRSRTTFKRSVSRSRNNFKHSVNRSRSNFKSSVSRSRSNFKRSVSRTRSDLKQRVGRSINRARDKGRQTFNRKREQFNCTANRQNQRAREKLKSGRDNLKKSFQQGRQEFVRKAGSQSERLKSAVQRKIVTGRENLARVKEKAAQISRRGMASNQAVADAVRRAKSQWGPGAGQAVAAYLSRAKSGGMRIMEQARPIMDRVSTQVRDPRVQRRVALGVLAAAGAAYYLHTHRQDMQYKVLNYGLERTMINVNGSKVSLKDVITSQILRQAPYLKDTRLANDPAAVLSYGVVAVGREDLMNTVAIVPDGRGNLRSVNEAIHNTQGAEQAMSALQMGSSLEGMAMHAADKGVFGVYGQSFTGSYHQLEGSLGK